MRDKHRVEQLLFGREVVQQPRRAHAGLLRDLAQRGAAAAIARHHPLRHGQDPRSPLLALREKRGITPLISHKVPFQLTCRANTRSVARAPQGTEGFHRILGESNILVFGSLVFTLRKGQHPWDVSKARSLSSRVPRAARAAVTPSGWPRKARTSSRWTSATA